MEFWIRRSLESVEGKIGTFLNHRLAQHTVIVLNAERLKVKGSMELRF